MEENKTEFEQLYFWIESEICNWYEACVNDLVTVVISDSCPVYCFIVFIIYRMLVCITFTIIVYISGVSNI